jgi:AcrR family transcriptional regulator
LSAQRRELDLAAAAAALVPDGTDLPSMAAIARAVGVAKPTLYRLAGSRDELVVLCIDAEAERLIGHLHETFANGSARDASDLVDAAVERYAAESPGGLELLFGGRYPPARDAVRRVEDRLTALLRRRSGALPRTSVVDAARLLGATSAGARRVAENRAAAEATSPATPRQPSRRADGGAGRSGDMQPPRR